MPLDISAPRISSTSLAGEPRPSANRGSIPASEVADPRPLTLAKSPPQKESRSTAGLIPLSAPNKKSALELMIRGNANGGAFHALASMLDGQAAANLRVVSRALSRQVAVHKTLGKTLRVAEHVANCRNQRELAHSNNERDLRRDKQDGSNLTFLKSASTFGFYDLVRDFRRDRKDRAAAARSQPLHVKVETYRANKASWQADVAFLVKEGQVRSHQVALNRCDDYLNQLETNGSDPDIPQDQLEELQRYVPATAGVGPHHASLRAFLQAAREGILQKALEDLESGKEEIGPATITPWQREVGSSLDMEAPD